MELDQAEALLDPEEIGKALSLANELEASIDSELDAILSNQGFLDSILFSLTALR